MWKRQGERPHLRHLRLHHRQPRLSLLPPRLLREVEAGVSGKVVNIAKNPGDSVTKGETVAILEAMKMEINVASPSDGTVSQVLVSVGDSVEPVTAIMTLA